MLRIEAAQNWRSLLKSESETYYSTMTTNVNTNNITLVPADNHQDNHNSDGDDTTQTQQTGQATGNDITNFNQQVQQNKILEFFSQKTKDTTLSMDLSDDWKI